MTSNPVRINWTSVLIASLSVWVLGVLLVFATILAYAFSLGWAARGAPDFAAIQRYANEVGPLWGPRVVIILTAIAGVWLGRRVSARPMWHGLLIGVVAGTPQALRSRFEIEPILALAVTVFAGAAGGWLGGLIKGNRR